MKICSAVLCEGSLAKQGTWPGLDISGVANPSNGLGGFYSFLQDTNNEEQSSCNNRLLCICRTESDINKFPSVSLADGWFVLFSQQQNIFCALQHSNGSYGQSVKNNTICPEPHVHKIGLIFRLTSLKVMIHLHLLIQQTVLSSDALKFFFFF